MSKRDQSSFAAPEPIGSHGEVTVKTISLLLGIQTLIFAAISAGAVTLWGTYHSRILALHPHAAIALEVAFGAAWYAWFVAASFCFWELRRAATRDKSAQRTAGFRVAFSVAIVSLTLLLACVPLAVLCGQEKKHIAPGDHWSEGCLGNRESRCDVIIVGAGLAGLSAARELQHLDRSVLILEASDRIGGRAYVGPNTPIDYGGAWIHGVPTNPLTPLVDSMGFKRERTEFDLPYFVNDHWASRQQMNAFEFAERKYSMSVGLAAKSVEDQDALSRFALSEIRNGIPPSEICRDLARMSLLGKRLSDLCGHASPSAAGLRTAVEDLRTTKDVASDYIPDPRQLAEEFAKKFPDESPKETSADFRDIINPLVEASAGPLESAAELPNTSAVDGASFEAGEDDLIDKGMGTFVKKLGHGLPVCLNSRVKKIDYSSADGVTVTTDDGKIFEGSYALVTVSIEVLRKKQIAFSPGQEMEKKLKRIGGLKMGYMQKVIIPFKTNIFSKEPEMKNAWVLYEGDIPPGALAFAERHQPRSLPLVNHKKIVMGFAIKPLDENVAIGFFGGAWAKALERQCKEKQETKNLPWNASKCDHVSVAITEFALSRMFPGIDIAKNVDQGRIRVTHWSRDPLFFGAYSVAEPGGWDQRKTLAEPLEYPKGTKKVFFAGEATAPGMYNGSYAGAYVSGLRAAREINAVMMETGRAGWAEGADSERKDSRLPHGQPAELRACGNQH